MKNLAYLFVLIIAINFPSKSGFAQNTFGYTYDDVGNRTVRQVIVLKSATAYTSDNGEEQNIDQSGKNIHRNEIGDITVSLFPNPTAGFINIETNNTDVTGAIYVYDQKGVLLINKTVQEKTTIDLSGQVPGNYILKVIYGNKSSEWKIIKE
ncbi:MAG: T9SS type A sorting domain-containing protein [Salinivirgaceae bacterium]